MMAYWIGSKTGLASVIVNHVNHPPVAKTVIDKQVVYEKYTDIKLNGSLSYDPDKEDRIISYSWSQVSGQNITLSNNSTHLAGFNAPSVKSETLLLFSLTVTDNNGAISEPAIVSITVKNVNIPPVANAGTDQMVNENATGVTLNGTKSYDRDGTIASYKWQQTSGPTVILNSTNTPFISFKAPPVKNETQLRLNLSVTDNVGAISSPSSVTNILVRNVNIPPIANASASMIVDENTTAVNLNGSSSYDKDGSITAYYWKQIAGPEVDLAETNTATPSFVAPSVRTNTTLTFELTVVDNDNANNPIPAIVSITVKNVNIPPVANAGTDQMVNENATGVTLNGTKSYDRDGTIASYKWQQIPNSTIELSNKVAENITFKAPSVTNDTVLRFNLTAIDNDNAISLPSTIAVTVKNVNIPPVANAGTDQIVNENATGVTLNGTKSYDRDGTLTAYSWSQVSGQNVILSNNSTHLANFTAPPIKANTTLAFRLTVADNDNDSSSGSYSGTSE